MDHMASAFERNQTGLCQEFVQAPKLTREVNEPISCPRHDDDRHFELVIPLCESSGRRRHRRRAKYRPPSRRKYPAVDGDNLVTLVEASPGPGRVARLHAYQ